MGRGAQLDVFQRGQITVWHAQGESINFMSQSLGKSCKAITNYLKDPTNYGKRFKGGRPSKLSEQDRRRIFREASKNKLSSSQLVAALDLNVSARAVRYKLSSNEIFEYVKRNATPSLTIQHKIARVDYAKRHLHNPPDWNKIIWSDEKKFNMDGPDGLQYYWRDLRFDHETYMSRKFGGKSVMVWGAFSTSGVCELAFLEGNQNADKYIWTLQDYLFPFAHPLYGNEILFQQDGASIHRAKTTMEFLDDQNVTIFEHPALSPDLNPIENLWGIIVRDVYANGKQYYTIDDLKSAIRLSWSNITLLTLQDLVKSMPKRCTDVVEVKGEITKY
jgi:transposase